MDILFVDGFQQSSIRHFPVGINLLSAIINKNSNYTSEVISFPNLLAEKKVPNNILLEKDYETIVKYILNMEPKIISFYTLGTSFFISLTIAKNIKKLNKNIKIILAGPHVSLCSKETLKTFDFIDMIAVGEGEQNVISILDYFNGKEEISNIKGICYRKSNEVLCNEPGPLLQDLDQLPMLELKDEGLLRINIESGRGCPYNCTFCCTKTFWKRKVRLKSTNRILDEIKHYVNRYNIKKFDFTHDLFTANKKYILEVCNKIIEMKMDIEWTCSARADTLDEEIISFMGRAGCKKILLGIETGSQRMQKVINKNLDMSQVKKTIGLIQKHNIEIQINFIYGLPTEEEVDLLKSLNLIRYCVEELSIKETTIFKCMCFPSTQIYRTERRHLVFNEENFHLFKYPAKNHMEWIKKYPNLFSSMYIVNHALVDKYFYLDVFINHIYNYFTFMIPKTMKEIIAFYNNSLLDFYLAYKAEMKKMTTLLTRTIYYGDDLSHVREEMSKSIENFIKNTMKDDFIAQLYQFENEVMKVVLNENSISKTFDYDMLGYYENHMRKKEKCQLTFEVTENKAVNIYKQ
ncbi:MAG: B12-binding domain-containing radical SAM protein [Clostridia bacterium]|nr:B12-binding domain-containing radical SAM protein [Clostridia bacterium]